ncbi:MAG: cytochrome c [Oscillochloris sp.]|nr:cytochrome c [Oscillochloris sp.]
MLRSKFCFRHRHHYLFVLVLLVLIGCSAAPSGPVDGARVYTIYCVGCHSRSPQAPAVTGPTLAMIMGRAEVQADPAAWLRQGIVNPNAEIAPGYQAGLMPATYGQSLAPAQIDALVQYMLAAD